MSFLRRSRMAQGLQPCCGLFAPDEVCPVPSVASELPIQPPARPEPSPGRPGASAKASSTPFDRHLDAAANPSPPPRAPDTRKPAKSSDAASQGARVKAADKAPPASGQTEAAPPADAAVQASTAVIAG